MFRDKIPGGKADYKQPADFSSVQLQKGINHELEHTTDPELAKEIAMDHLIEDPLYYDKLEKAKLQQENKMKHLFESWREHVNKLHEAECKIPIDNLEYERKEMPQIKPEQIQEFILQLQDQGVEVFKTRIKVAELKPSQSKLEWNKVQKLMKQGIKKLSHDTPIFVSKDNIIADGHHRWYALSMLDNHSDMPVWLVDMDIGALIHLMKRFEDTTDQSLTYNDQG